MLELRRWGAVLHLRGLRPSKPAAPPVGLLLELLHVIVHVMASCPSVSRVVVATCGAQGSADPSAVVPLSFPSGAALWGLVRAARLESSGLAFELLDLDVGASAECAAGMLS